MDLCSKEVEFLFDFLLQRRFAHAEVFQCSQCESLQYLPVLAMSQNYSCKRERLTYFQVQYIGKRILLLGRGTLFNPPTPSPHNPLPLAPSLRYPLPPSQNFLSSPHSLSLTQSVIFLKCLQCKLTSAFACVLHNRVEGGSVAVGLSLVDKRLTDHVLPRQQDHMSARSYTQVNYLAVFLR